MESIAFCVNKHESTGQALRVNYGILIQPNLLNK